MKAKDDLDFAKVGLESGYYSQVCFLSQQSVEKCLKAFLVYQKRTYPKTHKLVELWKLCQEIEKELSILEEKFKIIDEYYIPSRYPDAIPGSSPLAEPSIDNATEALDTAFTVYRIISDKVK